MSLDYDLTDVKDRDTSDAGLGTTQAIIFSTITAGMGEITESNWEEFYARVEFAARVDGVPQENRLTPEHIHSHIGLRTNVATETRHKWIGRFKVSINMLARAATRTLAEKPEQEAVAS